MSVKLTKAQIMERFLYLLTVAVTPSIPLFFLFSRNAAQRLLFSHFLILGGVLAAISLIIYILVSRLFLRRRRTMIFIAILWSAFWLFPSLQSIITRGNSEFSQVRVVVYVLAVVIIAGFVLRWISVNRSVVNAIAIVLCLLFAFNFTPGALAVSTSERQRTENERTGELPYEKKSMFHIDESLPSPNVYWLHMDGMMGFYEVERFFGDPQEELHGELTSRGFVVNKGARLEAGYTDVAIPALTSPAFFDSYLDSEITRVAHLVHSLRAISLHDAMRERGFYFDDIHTWNELVKAFSDAGYITIANQLYVFQSEFTDMWIDGRTISTDIRSTRLANIPFVKLVDFKDLITDASALSVIKNRIDEIVEGKRPEENAAQQIPAYLETVTKYITGYSDSDERMAAGLKAMVHVSTVQPPYFFYFVDSMAHCNEINGYEIGGVTYDEFIGITFIHDEEGNVYKERLDDPHDINLYIPQHRYAVKQMMAMIDTIIENDQDAVIVIQADHGIHGFGPYGFSIDNAFMFERGYSLEEQYDLTFSVMSGVRIPPQYGSLTQPLDPLDIARYLVNSFVGGGNYEYLFYLEEDIS